MYTRHTSLFPPTHQEMTVEEAATIKDFSKCDFTQIHRYYVERAEARKAMSKEEKAVIKAENEKILEEYGWAIVDGHRWAESRGRMVECTIVRVYMHVRAML